MSMSRQIYHEIVSHVRWFTDCFTEIYDVPGFSVHFGAYADSVYQALFSGLGTRLMVFVHVCACCVVTPLTSKQNSVHVAKLNSQLWLFN